jgi:hypothetical protein
MRIAETFAVLLSALLLFGCSSEINEDDHEPGPNGEPPKTLEAMRVYTKQFTVAQQNYALALGHIHSYLVAESYWITYTACFGEVPRTIGRGRENQYPCVALHAQKGPPTKAHLMVTVDEVTFNQLDHNNRLTYTVSIFGIRGHANVLPPAVESVLGGLYTSR